MTDIFYVFASISAVFFVVLIAKWALKLSDKICVICASVSLTWILFLAMFYLGKYNNIVILSLLIGESVIGSYYLIEKRMTGNKGIFRLPLLLTMTAAGYLLLTIPTDLWKIALLILLAWAVFLMFYGYRNNPRLAVFVKKVVECCKNW